MRLWRLLVEVGPRVWTFVVAARDHEEAWRLALATLAPAERESASLEELEAAAPSAAATPRVLKSWHNEPARRC